MYRLLHSPKKFICCGSFQIIAYEFHIILNVSENKKVIERNSMNIWFNRRLNRFGCIGCIKCLSVTVSRYFHYQNAYHSYTYLKKKTFWQMLCIVLIQLYWILMLFVIDCLWFYVAMESIVTHYNMDKYSDQSWITQNFQYLKYSE